MQNVVVRLSAIIFPRLFMSEYGTSDMKAMDRKAMHTTVTLSGVRFKTLVWQRGSFEIEIGLALGRARPG